MVTLFFILPAIAGLAATTSDTSDSATAAKAVASCRRLEMVLPSDSRCPSALWLVVSERPVSASGCRKARKFPNPPTIVSRVQQLSSGEWESKGAAFAMFTARMKRLGPHGFRAVLWHQGESDANQKDPTRTLSGNLYRQYLEQLIRESRREIGWDAPWFVAGQLPRAG